MDPNCYTHKANTVRTFGPRTGSSPPLPVQNTPDRLLPICLFSSVIPVLALSLLTRTNKHYSVYTHDDFVQTHMAPVGTTDGCLDSTERRWFLIRKSSRRDQWGAMAGCLPNLGESWIKIWSGIVNRCKVWFAKRNTRPRNHRLLQPSGVLIFPPLWMSW